MMHRFYVLLAAALASACAGQKGQTQPSVDKQKIINVSYFDLANCSPRSLNITAPVNQATVVGFLVAARPQILECLVDPKTRGPANDTRVFVDSTVGDGRSEHKVTGENLTPDGEACIRSALDRWTAANPVLSWKDGPPVPKGTSVTAHTEFQHAVNISPSVIWGQNEASDHVAKIRLAEKDWCDCFAPWKNKVPRPLRFKVKLASDKPSPEVMFELASDVTTEGVASCVKAKMQALPLKTQSKELTLTYPFNFVHSGVDEIAADAPPDVKFLQLEALRDQRVAEAAIAVGRRTHAVEAYDRLVVKYKANRDFALVRPMKESCAALLKTDDEWIGALQRELNTEQSTGTLIAELKAQDPQWSDADVAAQKQINLTRKDLETARSARTSDAGICPKEHY